MHVAINAQLLSPAAGYRSAGVSNYSRRLLGALGEAVVGKPSAPKLTAFVHAHDFAAPGVTLRQGPVWLENPALRAVWEQTALPQALMMAKVDLVHGLVNVLPLATPIIGVVTVHDLSFLRLPSLFPPLKRTYLTIMCRASVRRAAQVIAVSHQTASDVTRYLGKDQDRVTVVHNGVGNRFVPGTPEAAAAFRKAKGLPDRYWFYLGTLEPRKNLDLLLEAFATWQSVADDRDVCLVVAGGKGWYYDTIFAKVAEMGIERSVVFPGFVPDEELPDWYRAAELFIYPSRFEGFGMPVLEAMACGTPVMCSAAPGVAEVAGDAAIQVPADDIAAWVAAMDDLARQPEQRAALAAAGPKRAAQFTWAAAAAATLAVYDRALRRRKRR
jgi:glycosyltransferase involved in cell wall biosynthesis